MAEGKYRIVGKQCGRDKNGVFVCVCGKCELIDPDICENGNNGCNDRGDSGNSGDDNGYGKTS